MFSNKRSVLFAVSLFCVLSLEVFCSTTASAQSTLGVRKSLIPLAEPLWLDLTAPQQNFLKPLQAQWYALSATERKSWVSLADKLPKMNPAAQKKAAARVNEWAALSQEQRRLARENYRLAQNLPKEEREAQWEKYRSMTPAQRSVLRSAGTTSNTAALSAGATTGLAKEAAQPIKEINATPAPKKL
jgi:Protein of unknown function (DUF3106)